MTNDDNAGPYGMEPMPSPPDADGSESVLASRSGPPPQPVAAAAKLWSIVAGVCTFAYGFAAFGAFAQGTDSLTVAAVALTVVSLLCWRFGQDLRAGHDRRTALAVFGILASLSLIPLVLVIPALVLQYRPASNRWFAMAPEPNP
ncbi:hypothetical protein [Kibdelosporangium phytohabitans]|uniref:Uncharacterized protein n=1 Tax=Kibdelosporangium phytohabitans TaxID=860235 RepID=A0A0N9I390_9PSEU|nr:hypothetical protein [Kibdelosporangium phytohabitans]ALG10509.1 hypothetical protein AOZ06_29680 [Kibdelosporangium phytohabitans]MBE1461602.1 hypothetical protein [Kibdelosporangium phytohabitans]